MSTAPLALSNLVDITVTVAPAAPAVPSFNQGLFVGPSAVIPSYGANSRLRQYGVGGPAALAGMISDGFITSDPEYIACQLYFSQTPSPNYIWIGRQDLTAISALVLDGRTVVDGAMSSSVNPTHLTSATADFVSGDVGSAVIVAGAGATGAALVTTISSITSTTVAVLAAGASTTVSAAQTSIGALGSGYATGDEFTITQSGGTYGVGKALTVGIGGQLLTAELVTQGTGYTTATGLATVAVSPSTGTGLEVNITANGETLLQATVACRAASTTWYGLVVNNPSLSDNLALSEWADPLWQTTRYYPFSVNANIPNGVTDNLALQLQTLKLRVLGTYAITQSGLYPNNIYAAAAVMGVEMGLNTGLAGSFFNTSYKVLAGIAPEPLTQNQYTNIVNAGFNVYANFGAYQFYQPGFMSNGAPSFLWLFLAMLIANIQLNELAVLADNPVVSQTNVDEQLLINAANEACALLADIGFLAGGTWEGVAFNIVGVGIAVGQALPLGYSVQAQPYSQQSTEARDAGQAMPLYIFVTTAGAVQSLLIGVYVTL